MKNYLTLLEKVLKEGEYRATRGDKVTRSLFGESLEYNLLDGLPVMTVRPAMIKHAIVELFWFLGGTGNVEFLRKHGNQFWEGFVGHENTDTVGPMYPEQLRNWKDYHGGTIDQLGQCIYLLNNDPFSRRIVFSYWNPAVMPNPYYTPPLNVDMGNPSLAPCHTLVQFYVHRLKPSEFVKHWVYNEKLLQHKHPEHFQSTIDRLKERREKLKELLIDAKYITDEAYESISLTEKEGLIQQYLTNEIKDDDYRFQILLNYTGTPNKALDMKMYQRSCDLYLGAPSNIYQYTVLQSIVAATVDMVPARFIYDLGDVHLYANQWDNAEELLSREPLPSPLLMLKPNHLIDNYQLEDVRVVAYQSHSKQSKVPVEV